MAQDNTDPRSTEIKQTMAEHFAEYEASYRDAEWCSIVYEDDTQVVIADHKGFEHSEWSDEFETTEFSSMMHELARQVTDYSWSASWPVVFDKTE